jgi:malate permease and related proteins
MVMMVFLPALTFHVLATAPLTMDLIGVPIVSMVTALVCLGLSVLVFGVLFKGRMERPTAGALILAATFCNATYLGLPVVTAVVGPEAARVAILFDLLGMSVILFTVGTIVCVEMGTRGTKHTFGAGLRQVLTLPPLIAAVLGIVVNLASVPVPDFLIDATQAAGKVVAPIMLFSIGLALRRPSLRVLPTLTPVLVIKLVLAPLLAWIILPWLISEPSTSKATLLEAAMPTMVLTMVFAERYGLDEDILAQAIVVSTLIALFTIPIISSFSLL